MKFFVGILIAVFVSLSCVSVFAQSGRGSESNSSKKANQRPEPTAEPSNTDLGEIDDTDIIKFDIELVTIPVRVLDRKGRSIPGLAQKNFQVFEDGKPQEIAYFSNERKPFTVALVLDVSYSGTNKINEIQQAALAFVAQLQDNDRVMVVSFDEQVHILTEPTSDRKELYRAIKTTKIAGGTSVYEAMETVIQKFQNITGNKAIVLFSDGVDTSSRKSTEHDNLRDSVELDALIYSIKYDTYADVQRILNGEVVPQPPTTSPIPGRSPNPTGLPFPLPAITIDSGSSGTNDPRNNGTGFPGNTQSRGMPGERGTSVDEYRNAAEYLQKLSDNTGGQLYEADAQVGNLGVIFSRIAQQLREFYNLGYYPPEDGKSDKFRKIKIKVDQKGVAVKARDGYVPKKKPNQ